MREGRFPRPAVPQISADGSEGPTLRRDSGNKAATETQRVTPKDALDDAAARERAVRVGLGAQVPQSEERIASWGRACAPRSVDTPASPH
jgi:hypothetical protein